MDKQPSKRRRLAADTLSSSKDMEIALNKSLPKRGCGSRPVQTAPLTEEAVTLSRFSPLQCLPSTGRPTRTRRVSTLTGMIMGCAMVVTKPPASTVPWSTTTKLMPGPNGDTNAIVSQRSRPCTRDRTRRLTPAHKAVTSVCPSTTPRKRAKCLHPSIVLRQSWNAWSVIRRQLLPLRRRLRRSSTRC
jgi:hypothetical protein